MYRNKQIVTKIDHKCQIRQLSSEIQGNLQSFIIAGEHSSPENLFELGIRFIRNCSSTTLDLLVDGVNENGYIKYTKGYKDSTFLDS